MRGPQHARSSASKQWRISRFESCHALLRVMAAEMPKNLVVDPLSDFDRKLFVSARIPIKLAALGRIGPDQDRRKLQQQSEPGRASSL